MQDSYFGEIMKLSTRTRYGIRAMLEIALHEKDHPVDLNEISTNQGISKKYLHTLLVSLKNSGFITSIRGKSGGYLLAKRPDEINLFELYKILEGAIELVECVKNEELCKRSVNCTTKNLWDRLSQAIRRELESTTLEDLVNECIGNDNVASYDI